MVTHDPSKVKLAVRVCCTAHGDVAEWIIAAVLKTAGDESCPEVRILPSPHLKTVDMEEKQKKIYYHSEQTMRQLVESINQYQIHASDIV